VVFSETVVNVCHMYDVISPSYYYFFFFFGGGGGMGENPKAKKSLRFGKDHQKMVKYSQTAYIKNLKTGLLIVNSFVIF